MASKTSLQFGIVNMIDCALIAGEVVVIPVLRQVAGDTALPIEERLISRAFTFFGIEVEFLSRVAELIDILAGLDYFIEQSSFRTSATFGLPIDQQRSVFGTSNAFLDKGVIDEVLRTRKAFLLINAPEMRQNTVHTAGSVVKRTLSRADALVILNVEDVVGLAKGSDIHTGVFVFPKNESFRAFDTSSFVV